MRRVPGLCISFAASLANARVLMIVPIAAQSPSGAERYVYVPHMGWDGGGGMIFGSLMMVLILVLIVAAAFS
jgi:hypothetical protein